MNRVFALTAIARVCSRNAGHSANAVRWLKVETRTNTWRCWSIISLHVCVRINEKLTLAGFVALKFVEGNAISDIILAHLLVSSSTSFLMSVGAERHDMAHVSLGKLFHCSTPTIALALLICVANIDAAIHWGVILLLVTCQDAHVHLIVPLVAPVVLGTGQALAQQTQHRQHHVRCLLLAYQAEFFEIDRVVLSEAQVEHGSHFFKRIYTLLKRSCTPTLLSKFALSIARLTLITHGHARNDCRDVHLGDHLIIVEVINVENELHLLIKLRAVDAQKTRQKLFGT